MFVGVVLGIHHRGLARPGRRERPSPSCCLSRSPWRSTRRHYLRDHPALVHLLGRALRRSHHVHPLQQFPANPGRSRPRSTATRWAQLGRAGSALTAAFTSSFIGALIAVIMITFLSPVVAGFALRFRSAEFFSVYLLTFCRLCRHERRQRRQDIASMMIGFALAGVGLDSVTGNPATHLRIYVALEGVRFLIAVIGLFGIGEILETLEEGLCVQGASAKINMKVVLETWKELPRYWATSLRSAR